MSNLNASLYFQFSILRSNPEKEIWRDGNFPLLPTAHIRPLPCDVVKRGTWNVPAATGVTQFNSGRTFGR
jgi:hypothetical protein